MSSTVWRDPANPDIQRYPNLSCPYCGKTLNAAAIPGGGPKQIEDGDSSLCIACVQTAIFVVSPLGEVSMRKATPDEQAELDDDDDYQLTVARVRGTKAAQRQDWHRGPGRG